VAVLWEMGTQGVEVRPAAGTDVELLAFFEQASDPLPALAAALASLQPASLEPAVVPEVDWVARFREGFRGFAVGRFDIVPAWQAAVPQPGRIPLVVDPGQAFGTGTHESTRLCLAALEEIAAAGTLPRRVLDVGTGSGILAIAAWRLGAPHVVAIDSDAEAVRAARRHAQLNAAPLALMVADGASALQPAGFGLVVANVAAPFLCNRAAELAGLLAPRGLLVLSGLLSEDREAVCEAYACLGSPELRMENDWLALIFGRTRP
jgi:ribosomal protein L11 methyltransferase